MRTKLKFFLLGTAFSITDLAFAKSLELPTGQVATPLAAKGAHIEPLTARIGPYPESIADGAAAIFVSPDMHESMALTSFHNQLKRPGGSIGVVAQRLQTLQAPNSCSGIAWAPDGKAFSSGEVWAKISSSLSARAGVSFDRTRSATHWTHRGTKGQGCRTHTILQ